MRGLKALRRQRFSMTQGRCLRCQSDYELSDLSLLTCSHNSSDYDSPFVAVSKEQKHYSRLLAERDGEPQADSGRALVLCHDCHADASEKYGMNEPTMDELFQQTNRNQRDSSFYNSDDYNRTEA